MSWLWVAGAATAEVCGVIGLKLFSTAKGKAHLLLFVGGFSLSFVLLYVSFQFWPSARHMRCGSAWGRREPYW